MGRLTDKVAIVTGAARGMGAAIARRFLEEGAIVTLTDVLPEVVDTATALGERARGMVHDVADEAGWETLVAEPSRPSPGSSDTAPPRPGGRSSLTSPRGAANKGVRHD